MNRISDLTRRLWAALLALCLVLALTLPVFAEGESETADTAEKETFHIGTVDDLLQLGLHLVPLHVEGDLQQPQAVVHPVQVVVQGKGHPVATQVAS